MYIDSISKTGGTQLTTHDAKLYIQDKLIWPYGCIKLSDHTQREGKGVNGR